jgi:subtilisin family serine protease
MYVPQQAHGRLPLLLATAVLAILASFSHRYSAASAGPVPLTGAVLRRALIAQSPIPITRHAALTSDELDPADQINGEAAVTFAPEVSPADAAVGIHSMNGTILGTVPRLNVYEVRLPEGMPVAEGIATLRRIGGAIQAEPLVQLHADLHPNDPLYATYQAAYLQQIHAEEAWSSQLGDPGVVVAVLDSGVDLTHPDLRNQIWTNPHPGLAGCGDDVHGCNFIDPGRVSPTCRNRDRSAAPNPDVQAYTRGELNYHGTFVSGVIAAGINNGIGVTGIAPHASIMPVRVGDCTKPYDLAIANGIFYAADNGAAVINLSIGASCRPWPSFLLDALAYAEQRGVIVVAASGNDHLPCVDSPANAEGVIAVGAVAADGQSPAGFSNWGPQITVVAPGVNIVSTVPLRNQRPPNDLYTMDDGTSYAAPIVSGLAALLLSQDPLLTPELVRELIQRGATPLPDAEEPGWAGAGRIDLAGSLRLVPGALYGRVTQNGRDLPDGSAIEARIGGRLCGQAESFSSAGQSAYVLFVSTAADRAGCGTPGANVSVYVNGIAAGVVPFSAAALPLDLPAAVQPSTETGAATSRAAWNLVAGPTDYVLNGSRGELYALHGGDDSYEVLAPGSALEGGVGYWAFFAVDTAVPLTGDSLAGPNVTLSAGRYAMIGNPRDSNTVTVTGSDVVYIYDPGRRTYVPAMTLQQGQGAWALSLAGSTATIH